MMILRLPIAADEASFRRAVAEFQAEDPEWPFAFHFDKCNDFAEYVDMLEAWTRGERLPEPLVPNTSLVGVIDGEIVGRVSLRHRLNEFLLREGGNIGYGVVPSFRGRGYAKEMLRLTLPYARAVGLQRALLTCDIDNHASRRTIEANGGVLENILGKKRRYWIDLKSTQT